MSLGCNTAKRHAKGHDLQRQVLRVACLQAFWDHAAMEDESRSRLEHWLNGNGIASGAITAVHRLSGGTQNLLYRITIGGTDCVLRRPAVHARPEAEETIRREAQVLASLAATPVPHPRFRGHCDDKEVIGASFLITDAVEGFNAAVGLGETALANAAVRRRMGLAMVEGIAAIAAVDPMAEGLAGFGKLDTFIERQVPRWQKQLEGYDQFPDWPGPGGLDGVGAIGEWLDAHRPKHWQRGLMHGDFHIGNVLFGPGGDLTAILDWELSTLGDPLLDLGRLLAAWPDPDGSGPLSLKVEPWDAFPVRDELIAHYAACTGRAMDDLVWFEVLACYKLAIILEGTYARASAGLADRDVGERLHRGAVVLIARARRTLEQEG